MLVEAKIKIGARKQKEKRKVFIAISDQLPLNFNDSIYKPDYQ